MDLKKRNTGIDLFRCVSMLMIVILHILLHGGILDNLQAGSVNYKIAWTLECAAYCGVNCYALISGYVGINAGYRYGNIIYLWLQVVFFQLMSTVFFLITRPESVVRWGLIRSFFPVSCGTYWYFTSYFAMFFFIPFMNYLVLNMKREQLRRMVILLIVLFSLLPTLVNRDIFGTDNGYNVFWLMALYIVGAYLRKYGEKHRKGIYPFIYLGCVAVTVGSRLVIEFIADRFGLFFDNGVLISYTSPTILAAAIALLLFFSQIMLPEFLGKVFFRLSGLTFGVYLLHDNPLIRQNFITGRLSSFAQLSPVNMVVTILLIAGGIYLLGCFIDYIRLLCFRVLKIRAICEKISLLTECFSFKKKTK